MPDSYSIPMYPEGTLYRSRLGEDLVGRVRTGCGGTVQLEKVSPGTSLGREREGERLSECWGFKMRSAGHSDGP